VRKTLETAPAQNERDPSRKIDVNLLRGSTCGTRAGAGWVSLTPGPGAKG
jgi:hypothetical protein